MLRGKLGGEVVRHPQYGVQHVLGVVSLVLSAATSLRGAGRAGGVRQEGAGLGRGSPSWSSPRVGVLRLGYDQLTRATEHGRAWVGLVDPVVQTGQEKGWLIVGIRLRAVPAAGEYLTPAEVEPSAVCPVTQSNGELVYPQLEAARKQPGVPREILSDQGSELPKGITRFCQAHPETSFLDDVKPKVAAGLKRDLGADPTWQAFTPRAGQTTPRVQPTALAALAPPRHRRKARYVNAGELGDWGVRRLKYLDEDGRPRQEWDPQRVDQEVGWVRQYRQEVEHWRQGVEVGTRVAPAVKTHGLSPSSAPQLPPQLAGVGTLPRTQQLRAELREVVTAEAAKAKDGERLGGSREVLESLFGKGKRVEGDQARSGLTGLVLILGARVSPTSAAVIRQALESVPTKTVLTGGRQKLGKTVQATRRPLFVPPRNTEQKQDQIKLAA